MIKLAWTTLFLLSSISVHANESAGSPLFREITFDTVPLSNRLQFSRQSGTHSNAYFSNVGLVRHLRNTPSVYGPGERHAQAAKENWVANMTMTSAHADPRSVEFVGQSLTKSIESGNYPITAHSVMDGNDGNSDLGNMQYGNPNNRYMDGIKIEPAIGTVQTADNEQAFQSTYDNILLGRAEEALFTGDENQAKEYFADQARAYTEGANKQHMAKSYQRVGIDRMQQTAAKFRDFYQMKAQATDQNLNKMPTRDSLVSGCQKRSANVDRNGVYNYIMDPIFSTVSFATPSYSNDFCSDYVDGQLDYLVRNEPVRDKLDNIVKDSVKMSNGLGEIEKTLGNRAMSVGDIITYLSNNPTWKELGLRNKEWKECAKKKCLDEQERKIKAVLDYEGGLEGRDLASRELRQLAQTIIQSGRLPNDLKGPMSKFASAAAAAKIGHLKGIDKKRALELQKKKLRKGQGTWNAGGINGARSFASREGSGGIFAANSALGEGTVIMRAAGTGARDSDGILRTPSGKPVPGYESPSHFDLFKIISIRYKKKFNNLKELD
jgi:hypothetical protein